MFRWQFYFVEVITNKSTVWEINLQAAVNFLLIPSSVRRVLVGHSHWSNKCKIIEKQLCYAWGNKELIEWNRLRKIYCRFVRSISTKVSAKRLLSAIVSWGFFFFIFFLEAGLVLKSLPYCICTQELFVYFSLTLHDLKKPQSHSDLIVLF